MGKTDLKSVSISAQQISEKAYSGLKLTYNTLSQHHNFFLSCGLREKMRGQAPAAEFDISIDT